MANLLLTVTVYSFNDSLNCMLPLMDPLIFNNSVYVHDYFMRPSTCVERSESDSYICNFVIITCM